ncbi:hypothetical protein T05_14050 [Trichinella murrelli]|uniref:Uncharacterized protein n=1 Tax=Trichinella murrelli TaxID=144512 RepID=A0A0V0SYS7_9BILA|nr:hypothetical protein T05_14050 [Trichinella murrelli]
MQTGKLTHKLLGLLIIRLQCSTGSSKSKNEIKQQR